MLQTVSLCNGDNLAYKIVDESSLVCLLRKILEKGRVQWYNGDAEGRPF